MTRPHSPLSLAIVSLIASTCLSSAQAQNALVSPAGADSKTSESQFLRIRKSPEGQPLALQTSVTRYRDVQRGLLVDLVAVVHIGEAEYYRRLDKQLSLYDVVLYELVAPEGMQVPTPDRKSEHPIAWLQSSMRNLLGLESQLERIDYTRANFVHADLTPEQMGQRMASRGDTPVTIGLSALADLIRDANRAAGPTPGDQRSDDAPQDVSELVDMATDPIRLKRFMAQQFTRGDLEYGLGQTLNQLLIKDRNDAAFQVLKDQIAKGNRHIAIFYGAAHMPDFERRLRRELGMKKTRQAWVDAWDLTRAPDTELTNGPAQIFRQLLKAIDQ